MEQTKPLYETTFIVNAALEDTQIDTVIGRVQELITSNGGEVTALNKWGRKRLAYTISKKNNGFYVNLEFRAPGQLVAQMERFYQLEENVIRHLTIQVDKKAIKSRISPPPLPTADTSAAPPPAVPEKEPLFEDEKPTDKDK